VPATASDPRRGGRWRRPPFRLTLRLRLTLLYGGCFLVAGAALLGITYALVSHTSAKPQQISLTSKGRQIQTNLVIAISHAQLGSSGQQRDGRKLAVGPGVPIVAGGTRLGASQSGSSSGGLAGGDVVPGPPVALRQFLSSSTIKGIAKLVRDANIALTAQQQQTLGALLTESGLALAIMALLSIGLGWLLAGRALRPLRTMNLRAREITEDNLNERLGVEGRADELGELAATFDGVLGRLERAFASQRRFVANASHELRTPITLQRALVEVALADPNASADELRRTCTRVVAAGEQQERVIEALLALARGQAGIESRIPIDLAEVASDLLSAREAATLALHVHADLQPAIAAGDRALLERLVANLLDNAIVHNTAHDRWIEIETCGRAGGAWLRIANGGDQIPPDEVEELFEPFRRLDGDRSGAGEGLGLGLSIVRAIASAHGATVAARALGGGGLELELGFPRVAPAPGDERAAELPPADPFPVQRA